MNPFDHAAAVAHTFLQVIVLRGRRRMEHRRLTQRTVMAGRRAEGDVVRRRALAAWHEALNGLRTVALVGILVDGIFNALQLEALCMMRHTVCDVPAAFQSVSEDNRIRQ